MSGSPVPAPIDRFVALDSLRGLCAIAVCLFHFRAAGPISTSDFIGGSWLFVDFFFVLSGFVITANYRSRLSDSRELIPYIVLRFARVWPLHVVVLVAYILMELLGSLLDGAGIMQRVPFTDDKPVYAIFTNLTFTQIFGIEGRVTWNQPAWSIAAEFWTYLIFAAICFVGARSSYLILAIVAVAAAALLAYLPEGQIALTHSGSLIRCVYGFSTGGLAWAVWERLGRRIAHPDRPADAIATAAEVASLAFVVAYVSNVGISPANLAAPVVFGVSILIFAHQRGRLSQLLKLPFLVQLGTLSYSIYMVHAFVQSRFDDALRLFGSASGIDVVTDTISASGRAKMLAGSSATQGVVFTVLMLCIVFITASLTYKYVEQPALGRARRLVRRRKSP